MTVTSSRPLPGRRLTSFVGRDDDVVRLIDLVDASRLVTLLGSGGVGKTRLVEEVATHLAEDGHEIAWVELAPVQSDEQVPEAVASAVGIDQASGELTDLIAHRISARPLRLFMDNAEHLIDATARLAHRLLAACPNLHILVTSREVLGVEGETIARLNTLGPDAAALLLTDRAAAANPTLDLHSHQAEVTRICQRLDGIPLALELAAARLRMLTPGQVADALDDRFTLLTGGPRTALPRQQTLEASVAWSVDLLDPHHRQLLADLSAFAGSFTLDAAAEVAGDDIPEHIIRTGVLELVDRSLVHTAPTALDQPRFRLLETIRAYAGKLLAEDPDRADRIRRRHIQHYIRISDDAERALQGPMWKRVMAMLDQEAPDLMRAIRVAHAQSDVESVAAIVGGTGEYWVCRPQMLELEPLMAGVLTDRRMDTRVLARAGIAWNTLRAYQGLPHIIQRVADEADGVPGAERYAANSRAWALIGTCADVSQAEALVALAEDLQPLARGDLLITLGRAYWRWGPLERALELSEQGVAMLEQVGNTKARGGVFPWVAQAAMHAGHLSRARELIDMAMPVAGDADDRVDTAILITLDATLRALAGDYDGASNVRDQATQVLAEMASFLQPLLAHSWGYEEVLVLGRAPASRPEATTGNSLLTPNQHLLRAAQMWLDSDHRGALDVLGGMPDDPPPYKRHQSAIHLVRAKAMRGAADHASATAAHEALTFHLGHSMVYWPDAVEIVAAVDADAGRHERAARLLAAAARRRDEMGTVRWPIDEDWVTDLTDGVRQALGADAFEAAWQAGLALDVDAATALARTGRVERPVRGWDALTPAEQETAKLAAEGLSNPDIADRLFISRNTVKTHLSAAYRKLAVSNRTALASAINEENRG